MRLISESGSLPRSRFFISAIDILSITVEMMVIIQERSGVFKKCSVKLGILNSSDLGGTGVNGVLLTGEFSGGSGVGTGSATFGSGFVGATDKALTMPSTTS